MNVRAQHFPSLDALNKAREPGGFALTRKSDDEDLLFWYCCPCGCGSIGPLSVGDGFKPAEAPSWWWNGSSEMPELMPSVNHVRHWHGWLRAGEWVLA